MRPLNSAAMQPYTHEGVFTASSRFDGEVSAVFTPYHPLDTATSLLVTVGMRVTEAIKSVVDVGRSQYRYFTSSRRDESSLVDALKHEAVVEPHCFSGDEYGMFANSTWTVKVVADNAVSGSIAVSIGSCNAVDSAADGCSLASLQSSFASHYNPSDVQKYRTISSAGSTDGALHFLGNTINEEARFTAGKLTSWSVQFIDDANAIINVVTRNGDIGSLCTSTVLLKRLSDTSEDRSVKSLIGTLVLMVVVAAVKFGPRQYMKWKGINPNSLTGRKLARVNKPVMTAEERERVLKQEADFIQSVQRKKQ